MAYLLLPILDNEAIPAEIKNAATQLCARVDQKELVCKVGPGETGRRLPQRFVLDNGITVEVMREAVLDGSIWLGVKGDPAI